MTNIDTINVYSLQEETLLSAGLCASLSEADAVCLAHHQHIQGVRMAVEGDLQAEFSLVWEQVTEIMQDSRGEMSATTIVVVEFSKPSIKIIKR